MTIDDDAAASAIAGAVSDRFGNVRNRVATASRLALLQARIAEVEDLVPAVCLFCRGTGSAAVREVTKLTAGWYHASTTPGGSACACRADALHRRLRALRGLAGELFGDDVATGATS